MDKLTEVAIDRFPHEPPAGLRGSIQERVGLADRIERRDANRDRWKSYQGRANDGEGVSSPFPVIRAATAVPRGISYNGGTEASWYEHGKVDFVATPNLVTPQETVSASRLHETTTRPETHSSNELRGLPRNLPRVYRDTNKDREVIVDGNHRLTTDLLQGKLFSEARVLTNTDLPKVRQTNKRIRTAERATGTKHSDDHYRNFIYPRYMNLHHGEGNW